MKYEPDIDLIDHNYHDSDWIALVTNINDPTFSGRCQVRVLGLMDNITLDHLPWAVPINSPIFAGDGAGSISIPKVGQFVRIQFNNGDIYAPEYIAIQNIDTELIKKIKDDYPGTHVLLHDPAEELLIIFQPKSGLLIYHKESFIQITPDTLITMSTPNGDSIIQMDNDVINITTKNEVNISGASVVEVNAEEVKIIGSKTTKIGAPPYQHAILGETFWGMMQTLATMVDQKYPQTAGVASGIVEAGKQSATSTNVLIGI